jgi:plastocyanin
VRSKLMFVSLLMIVAALISACGPGSSTDNTPSSAGKTVLVEGGEFFYSPADITVKAGETVTINFKNTGSVEHTFVIKEVNFKLVAQPGATKQGSFTAPAAGGSYEIHCDVPGHTEAGMQGKLNVVAAGN